jgi:hypothetical protein
LDWQTTPRAISLTLPNDGIRIESSNAIIAITTNNSIKVKAEFRFPFDITSLPLDRAISENTNAE